MQLAGHAWRAGCRLMYFGELLSLRSALHAKPLVKASVAHSVRILSPFYIIQMRF
jgi:hypothetical protein